MSLPADAEATRHDRGHLRHLAIRVGTFLAIGAIAAAVPSVGENRFLIGALLAFGIPPLIVALNLWDRTHRYEWVDVLIDVLAVVVVAQFVPAHWDIILLIGAIIVLSPASAFVKDQWKISLGAYCVLIPGMALAGWRGDVENWWLSLLCLLALVPTTLYYAKWRSEREEALREEASKLESLKLISGGVAHDFNNILAGVVGHAEFALDELGSEHPSRTSIDKVVSAAMRAALLARQLLTFSGGHPRNLRPVDLAPELRSAVDMIQPLLPKGAEVTLRIDDALPKVTGDAGQLQQVFLNLLMNAAEASGAGDVITFDVAFDHGPARIRCTIRDEGVGIAPEHVDRLFDPFFSTKTRGHGLGLANVSRILEAHDGRISVDSEPGRGTSFTVELPSSGEMPSAPAAVVSPDTAEAQEQTALVVDDDPDIRLVTSRFLSEAGWKVLAAADGEEGLRCWRAYRAEIDVVFLDLKMPGLDGHGVLAGIRSEDPELPVLVISGFDPEGAEADALASDPRVGVLSKPFRRTALDEALAGLRRGTPAPALRAEVS